MIEILAFWSEKGIIVRIDGQRFGIEGSFYSATELDLQVLLSR